MKKALAGVIGTVGLLASNAHAAITLPTALSVADVETLAGLVIAGLAVMWAIRKVIKITNRS